MMLNNRNALRILSLVIAILLWIYVTGEVNPETKGKITDIEINLTNTEMLADRGLAVVASGNETVSATIKGKRSVVNEAKKTGISASVDVSDFHKGNNSARIVLNLPDGIVLDSISREKTSFQVENCVEAEKPVEIEFIGSVEDKELEPWAYALEPEAITVRGAESSVDKVESVRGNVTANVVAQEPKTVEVDMMPVDGHGNEIQGLVLDSSAVSARIQLMKVKDVDVELKEKGSPDGVEIDSIEIPDSVKIIGTAGIVKDIETVEAELDVSEITGDCSKEFTLDLPKGLYVYSDEEVLMAEIKVK